MNLAFGSLPYLCRGMIVRSLILFCLILIFSTACLEEPDCFALNNNIIGISFKKLSNGQTDTVTLISVTAPDNNILFFEDTAVSRIYLPLNYFQDQTNFVFQDEGGSNAFHVKYIAQPQFVSEDCGERFVLSDLAIIQTGFDSIRVVSNRPGTGAGTNFEIYR